MKALMQELVAKADLTEAQAAKAAEVVRNFVMTKLPAPLRSPVESALTGQRIDSAADAAKGMLGGLMK